jgi:hypothetical protein
MIGTVRMSASGSRTKSSQFPGKEKGRKKAGF